MRNSNLNSCLHGLEALEARVTGDRITRIAEKVFTSGVRTW